MKIFTLLCCMLVSIIANSQQKGPRYQHAALFKKINGKWISEKKNNVLMGETWTVSGSRSMAGKSYMLKNGDTTILETVNLQQEGRDVFYIPVAYGQNDDKPVKFKLTGVKGTAWIFENPAHDFPRRIVYEFTGSTTLHAYIDDGTGKKRQHYYYKKQP